MTLSLSPEFRSYLSKVFHLRQTASLLQWDQETLMPAKATSQRADVLSTVHELIHQFETSTQMKQFIDEFEARSEPCYENQRLLYLLKRSYFRENCIPTSLVKDFAQTVSLANESWIHARTNNAYHDFAPLLEKVIHLQKKRAGLIKDALHLDGTLYDVLLDENEPKMNESKLDTLFSELRSAIVPMIPAIMKKQDTLDKRFLQQTYPIDIQKKCNHEIAQKIGFDFSRGVLAESAHPFSMGINPFDVRITTRFKENDFTYSLFSTIHETGHALYEQGLPDEYIPTPLALYASMGIHESQSLFFEDVIGRSRSFLTAIFPMLQSYYPTLSHISPDEFYQRINYVEPGYIRTDADEVTYSLHVIIRYQIEKYLFSESDSNIHSLPKFWNDKYKEYLGVNVPNDSVGILQDIHWSGGAFGYFPSYVLGKLYSAQLWETLMCESPQTESMISRADFAFIRNWLVKQIHSAGNLYHPEELIEKATSKPLSTKSFLDYLQKKYIE